MITRAEHQNSGGRGGNEPMALSHMIAKLCSNKGEIERKILKVGGNRRVHQLELMSDGLETDLFNGVV